MGLAIELAVLRMRTQTNQTMYPLQLKHAYTLHTLINNHAIINWSQGKANNSTKLFINGKNSYHGYRWDSKTHNTGRALSYQEEHIHIHMSGAHRIHYMTTLPTQSCDTIFLVLKHEQKYTRTF